MPNSKRKAHCNKVPHKTLLGAQIAATRQKQAAKRRGNAIVNPLVAYKCDYCENFHVGAHRREIDWKVVEAEEKRLKKLREGKDEQGTTQTTERTAR